MFPLSFINTNKLKHVFLKISYPEDVPSNIYLIYSFRRVFNIKLMFVILNKSAMHLYSHVVTD